MAVDLSDVKNAAELGRRLTESEGNNMLAKFRAAIQELQGATASIPVGMQAVSADLYDGTAGAKKAWLTMNGQEVSRATYSDLFAWAVGLGLVAADGYFGEGDGVNTFTLPDLTGFVIKGKEEALGAKVGGKTKSISHGHGLTVTAEPHKHEIVTTKANSAPEAGNDYVTEVGNEDPPGTRNTEHADISITADLDDYEGTLNVEQPSVNLYHNIKA